MPHKDAQTLTFRGEPVFRQNAGIVTRVPIGSTDVTTCNWLDNRTGAAHLAGYILTWSRTNAAERLDRLFAEGQIYGLEAAFTKPPPLTSTLWLHWIGH